MQLIQQSRLLVMFMLIVSCPTLKKKFCIKVKWYHFPNTENMSKNISGIKWKKKIKLWIEQSFYLWGFELLFLIITIRILTNFCTCFANRWIDNQILFRFLDTSYSESQTNMSTSIFLSNRIPHWLSSWYNGPVRRPHLVRFPKHTHVRI